MPKKPVHIAPILVLLILWPTIFQSVHRIQHHLPLAETHDCCHHQQCTTSQQEESNTASIDEFAHCFVCEFEFSLCSDIQFKGNRIWTPLNFEKIIVYNYAYRYLTDEHHKQLRAPPVYLLLS